MLPFCTGTPDEEAAVAAAEPTFSPISSSATTRCSVDSAVDSALYSALHPSALQARIRDLYDVDDVRLLIVYVRSDEDTLADGALSQELDAAFSH